MSAHPLLILRQEIKFHPSCPVSFHDQEGNVLSDLSGCRFIKIGQLIFLKHCLTNFKSKRGAGPQYPFETIAFLFSSPEISQASYKDYVQAARNSSAGIISIVDKKELVNYIINGDDTAAGADPNAPPCPSFHSFEDAREYKVEVEPSSDSLKLVAEPLVITTMPLHSPESLFRSTKDFSNVLDMCKDIFAMPTVGKTSEPISLIDSIKTASAYAPKTLSTPQKSFIPIIIVPAAPTAILTMHNVKEFLDASKFVLTADAKAHHSTRKENMLSVEHINVNGKKQTYQIIDNPARLSIEEWSRVSAVFVHGPTWQFKGWKWENPVEIFENICGFYLNFDDAAIEPSVASWNVHKLAISRSKRHLDSTAVLRFWETLDRFIAKRRSTID